MKRGFMFEEFQELPRFDIFSVNKITQNKTKNPPCQEEKGPRVTDCTQEGKSSFLKGVWLQFKQQTEIK